MVPEWWIYESMHLSKTIELYIKRINFNICKVKEIQPQYQEISEGIHTMTNEYNSVTNV